jgi:hypothetical protein
MLSFTHFPLRPVMPCCATARNDVVAPTETTFGSTAGGPTVFVVPESPDAATTVVPAATASSAREPGSRRVPRPSAEGGCDHGPHRGTHPWKSFSGMDFIRSSQTFHNRTVVSHHRPPDGRRADLLSPVPPAPHPNG